MGLKLLCFYSDHVMASEKWLRVEASIQGHPHQYLRPFAEYEPIFDTLGQRNALRKPDRESFAELVLEEGTWKHIAANEQGTLSVYSPNKHETFLRSGNYICQPKA